MVDGSKKSSLLPLTRHRLRTFFLRRFTHFVGVPLVLPLLTPFLSSLLPLTRFRLKRGRFFFLSSLVGVLPVVTPTLTPFGGILLAHHSVTHTDFKVQNRTRVGFEHRQKHTERD